MNEKSKTEESLHFSLWKLLFIVVGLSARGFSAEPSLPLAGDTFIHDPSTIIEDHGKYYVYGTASGIEMKSSPDLVHWTEGPRVFENAPDWTTNLVPEFEGKFWAPDVIRVNGTIFLYYAVSSWGKQVSAIGLVTNATVDPSAKNYAWHDCGMVIRSTHGDLFNTIDPSVMLDKDGKLWMAFGSYWEGIYLTELDPKTGMCIAKNSPLSHLAWHESIEATCLTRHDNYYYLFVDWGQCCEGVNSTYEVRMGRSKKVTGPYLDRDGNDMVDSGGTVYMKTNGRYIGPGHIGILDSKGKEWFSYHYYDADTHGRSRLGIAPLKWSADAWPVAGTSEAPNSKDQ